VVFSGCAFDRCRRSRAPVDEAEIARMAAAAPKYGIGCADVDD
jgi:hypothetical protein